MVLPACRKKPIAESPEEHGKLNEISANLETAFGSRALPSVEETPSLAARLRRWVDFRDCAVKTYVARRREAERARDKGYARPTHHASIGDETVEECAVQAAVTKDAARYCERLEVDFRRDDGEPPLAALRCWDTRARVLGRPQECPLLWLPTGPVGRNAECLAMAQRDASLCVFAPSTARCRALVSGQPDLCQDAPDNCRPALAYWEGLIPAGEGPALFEAAALRLAPATAETKDDAPEGLHFHLRFLSDQKRQDGIQERFQVQAPLDALGISWPTTAAPAPAGRPPQDPRWPQDQNTRFSRELAAHMAEVAFLGDEVSLRLGFQPAGQLAGVLPLRPPGPAAPATLVLVLAAPALGKRLVCQPAPETQGSISYKAAPPSAGGFVTGSIDATGVSCDDGSTARLVGMFRLAITNVR